MRLLLIFLVLASIVLVTFFIWGDSLMNIFSQQGSIQWLNFYGGWAWAAGILLLMGDLFLPLPATLIMSALGFIYGPLWGGVISATGSFMAGAAGYWLCRMIGERAAKRILGNKDFERGKRLSSRDVGGWVVVLSRWLPVFPEVVSCMAGLTRMPSSKFHAGLLCGCIPMGFTYAYIGYQGVEDPVLALALSAGVPPLIWLIVSRILKKNIIANNGG
jgi:uncharacterized membrane protein YdjX (TVP38/TMEM64 family)